MSACVCRFGNVNNFFHISTGNESVKIIRKRKIHWYLYFLEIILLIFFKKFIIVVFIIIIYNIWFFLIFVI